MWGLAGVLGWGVVGLGLPRMGCLITVGREKVCMLWGPKALERAESSLCYCWHTHRPNELAKSHLSSILGGGRKSLLPWPAALRSL